MKPSTIGVLLSLAAVALVAWLRKQSETPTPTATIPGQAPLNLSLSGVGARVVNTDSMAQTVKALIAAGEDRPISYEDGSHTLTIGSASK